MKNQAIENLMNELAGIWIDGQVLNESTKNKMERDFKKMCPGIKWKWSASFDPNIVGSKAILLSP